MCVKELVELFLSGVIRLLNGLNFKRLKVKFGLERGYCYGCLVVKFLIL